MAEPVTHVSWPLEPRAWVYRLVHVRDLLWVNRGSLYWVWTEDRRRATTMGYDEVFAAVRDWPVRGDMRVEAFARRIYL